MPRLGDEEAAPDPVAQFRRWLDQARSEQWPWAEVMTLATATPEGRPSARAVVLRSFDDDGLLFHSDYQSRKADELDTNPWAAAVFLWAPAERQVRVEGRVEKTTAEEADRHFEGAPRAQRLAVWASEQSHPVPSRDELRRRLDGLEARFHDQEVPRPPRWGTYRLVPTVFELWQGRPDRLHDRVRYRRQAGGWVVDRLSP